MVASLPLESRNLFNRIFNSDPLRLARMIKGRCFPSES